MKVFNRIFVMCVFVTALSAVSVQGADLSSAFPDSTAVYFEWCGAEQASKALEGSSFGELINEPEVKQFRGKIVETVSGYLPILGMATGKMPVVRAGLNALSICWERPGAIGWIGIEVTVFGQAPGILWVVDAGDDAGTMQKSMEMLLTAIPGVPVGTNGVFEGRTVRQIEPAYVPTIRLMTDKGRFMMVVGDDAAEIIFGKEQHAPLNGVETFRNCRKQMQVDQGRTLTFGWVNVDEVRKVAHKIWELMSGEETFPETVETILEEAGLNSLNSLCCSLRVSESGGFIQSKYLGTSDTGKGIGKLLMAEPLDESDFRFVPKDATFAVLLNKDIAASVDEVLRMAEVIHPNARALLDHEIATLESQTKLKIREDFLPALGGTIIVFDAPSDGGLLGSGTTVIIESNNIPELTRTIKRIVRLIAKETNNGTVFVKETSFGEYTITYTNFLGGQMPFSPSWAEYEGHLIVGLFPQIVKQTLERVTAADAGKRSILANEAFVRARKELPKNASFVSYADTPGLYSIIDGLLLPGWSAVCGQLQKMTIDLDVSILPRRSVVKRHLFPDVRAFAKTDGGFICENYGPLPVSLPDIIAHSALSTAAAAAFSYQQQKAWEQPKAAPPAEDSFLEELEEIDSKPLDEQGAQPDGSPGSLSKRVPGQMARKRVCQQTLAPGGTIAVALDFYRVDCGRFPTTEEGIVALVKKPDSLTDEQWNGPYLRDETILVDPWGHGLVYESDGIRFSLSSWGPDGKPGTDDDIHHKPRVE